MLANSRRATLNKPCSSGAECADSECCLGNMRPIGKRSIGHCSAMGTDGSGNAFLSKLNTVALRTKYLII